MPDFNRCRKTANSERGSRKKHCHWLQLPEETINEKRLPDICQEAFSVYSRVIVENLEVSDDDFCIGEVKFDVVDIVLLEFG